MHCHLIVPGLLPPRPLLQEIGSLPRLPALDNLLARGHISPQPAIGLTAWLCRAFGVAKQQDWPIAPLTLLAQGGQPGSHYWLRADPVHLRIALDRLILSDSRSFGITAEEAEALISSLNRHFQADGWTFFAPTPTCWYLRVEQAPILETTPLAEAAGGYVENHMPRGADAPHWRALLNELQMLVHEHPVNLAREDRDEPVINSVWPWGGGTLAALPAKLPGKLWADDALAQALAITGNTPSPPPPANAAEWLNKAGPDSAALVVLDQLATAAQYGNAGNWLMLLEEMERDWFAPLSKALRQGKLKKLTLHALGAQGAWKVDIDRRDLWKVWRRGVNLAALAIRHTEQAQPTSTPVRSSVNGGGDGRPLRAHGHVPLPPA